MTYTKTSLHVGPLNTWLYFWCPACRMAHGVPVDGPSGWKWNGSRELPTLDPSLLISLPEGKSCHFNLTNGQLVFHADSSHTLAGQTVELPDWEQAW